MNIAIINKGQPIMNFPRIFPGELRIVVSFDAPELPGSLTPYSFPGAYLTALGPHPRGFYAGANRNHALQVSYEHYGKSGHVLFLDGDRIPDAYDREIILETLSKYEADALLLTCKNGPLPACPNDPRSIALSSKMDGLVDAGCLVSEFFSCGFVLSDRAIEKVMAANDSHLFHPAFNGHWGEEDKYLGIQLHNLGFRTCFTNRIKLGGGALGKIIGRPDYALSLQIRMSLMLEHGYPMRHNDMYAHLEKDAHGKVIKVYDGVPQPYPL